MGLVVETIPQATTIVTEPLTQITAPVTEVIDEYSVVLSEPFTLHVDVDRVCNDSTTPIPQAVITAIDPTIYNVLTDRESMKTVEYPAFIKNEFDLFLRDAVILTDGGEVSADFLNFNEYLGQVGVAHGIC